MNLLKMKKGFTLIELLVVIAIIGILAAVIITALAAARQKADDTQTKSNVDGLSTALEQYYNDQTTGAYPVSATQLTGPKGTGFSATSILTTDLAPYVTDGASSAVFTGYSDGNAGYISSAAGSTYLAAGALLNQTEGTVTTGNGDYLTDAGGVAGSVTANGLTLANLNTGTNNAKGRAFVVYGPQ